MIAMFFQASSFNQDLSNWDVSRVEDMSDMFSEAASFHQNLCAWGGNFPFDNATDIFQNSGCMFQDTPIAEQKGPFCASECN
jgi:surface protein